MIRDFAVGDVCDATFSNNGAFTRVAKKATHPQDGGNPYQEDGSAAAYGSTSR